ncbi:MAG: hypothetical protein PW788_04225 [Micavibrio sp.]|nr:hypothetical protein [Micavibrio sp.]
MILLIIFVLSVANVKGSLINQARALIPILQAAFKVARQGEITTLSSISEGFSLMLYTRQKRRRMTVI